MERPNPLLCFGLLLGPFAPLLWEWGGYVAQVGRLSYALWPDPKVRTVSKVTLG